ncbi:MAG: OadG family protein [Lachnospiraceae bacterium]|nr:OadG family protein [Lachnospiraceae bacterium]
MRQIKNRFWLMVCAVLCLCMLSGCSAADTNTKELDPNFASVLCQTAEGDLTAFSNIEEAKLDEMEATAKKIKDNALIGGLSSWRSIMPETGKLVKILSSEAMETEDGSYECIVTAVFEKRNVEFKVFYEEVFYEGRDNVLTATSYSFTPEYTTGEKMTKAAMNTAMGMGTVFMVLIFISVLISSFKYINAWENNQKAAKVSQAPAAPVPAPEPMESLTAEDLTEDLELVAVITAAIAAFDSTASADGLVVRSIKRVPGAKWKRA